MAVYSAYAVAEDGPPQWKPGEDLVCSGFFALTFYLLIDVNLGIYRAFRRRTGLYYWSMIIGIWACALNCVGLVLDRFKSNATTIWPLWTAFVLFGWAVYCPAELLVLYSRLHLINQNLTFQRWLLVYLLCASFVIIVPCLVLNWPAYNANSTVSSLWSPRMAISTRADQICFTVLEATISCVYIWDLLKLLKLKSTVRQRRVMRDLVCVNIICISLDCIEVVLVFLNEVSLAFPVQTLSYMLKFKLEFVVLNQLMAVAAKGHRKETFEERRYHQTSKGNDVSAGTAGSKETKSPWLDLSDCLSASEQQTSIAESTDLQRPAPSHSKRQQDTEISWFDGDYHDKRIEKGPTASGNDTEAKRMATNTSNAVNINTKTIDPPIQSTSNPSIHQGLQQRFKTKSPLGQGSDTNAMIPTTVKTTRENPRLRWRRNPEDVDDEEEEIGLHLWEKNGKVIMEVPWFVGRGKA